MNYFERTVSLSSLLKLLKEGDTGSPKLLADKLCVSERTFFRMIEVLKKSGLILLYDRKNISYVCSGEYNDID